MFNLSSGTIYKGNLMKNINGRSEVFKENVLLIYNEKDDVFYSFIDTFNLFLSNDLDNLTIEEINDINKKIDKYTYSYKSTNTLGDVYVSIDSLKVAFGMDNNKKINR